jgi:hypothetical protein
VKRQRAGVVSYKSSQGEPTIDRGGAGASVHTNQVNVIKATNHVSKGAYWTSRLPLSFLPVYHHLQILIDCMVRPKYYAVRIGREGSKIYTSWDEVTRLF